MTPGAQFLISPDLFPVRISGERWGNATYALDIPGGPFRIEGLSSSQHASLVARFGAETAPSGVPFVLTLFRAPESDFVAIDTRGWEYQLDLSFEPDRFTAAGLQLMARAELGGNRGGIWTPVDDTEAFWGVVENVLRPLVALRLFESGGLLVHSAGVISRDRGFLFAGISGTGKSTTAANALRFGRDVLSDDLNAVVQAGAGYSLQPLPFTGDLERHQLATRSAKLDTLVHLVKGESEHAVSLGTGLAASLLVRCAPYVNLDPNRSDALLARAGAIAASTTKVTLTFRRDADVWHILDAL